MIDPLEQIKNNVQNWLERKGLAIDFEVSIAQNLEFGDLTTNVALQASKNLDKNPREIAEELKSEIENWNLEFIDHVEVAGPGFINFFVSDKVLFNTLQNPINIYPSQKFAGKKVIVEFGDPNPFKQLHIGHLRNFAIGESFSRILESLGAEVMRVNYQGDVGLHVAKALYGLMANGEWQMADGKSLTAKDLAQAYAYGAREFEENDEAKKEIIEINKKIYEETAAAKSLGGSENSEMKSLWEQGRMISLKDFDNFYERFDIKYDKKYFESETSLKGREIVLRHIDDGIFVKDQGAVIYKGEKDGLHTRVFLTSQNYATYEGKDLGLALMKEKDLSPDISYILTGNEQQEYFQVMLAALKRIDPGVAEKTRHYTFGHVRLKKGKMSSRTGDVITAEWLLDEAVKKVKSSFHEIDSETSEKIGIGAVKYSMLKFAPNSEIHFDFDESISLEGNSGPYLQYTYVRARSVLTRSKNQEVRIKNIESMEKKEEELLRFLMFYPYIIEKAAVEFAPNILCNYLFELSQRFNLFYQKHKIIGSDQEEFRLSLTNAVAVVLKNGLNILGIETVEKM